VEVQEEIIEMTRNAHDGLLKANYQEAMAHKSTAGDSEVILYMGETHLGSYLTIIFSSFFTGLV
jgi:hypothetical protein